DWPRAVAVELIQDISGISSPLEGFLRRHRHRLKTILSDGQRTDVYVADFCDRAADRRNAIAVAAYARDPGGDPMDAWILLRRQMRYAAYLVTGQPLTTEVIAGILEGDEALEEAVIREVW